MHLKICLMTLSCRSTWTLSNGNCFSRASFSMAYSCLMILTASHALPSVLLIFTMSINLRRTCAQQPTPAMEQVCNDHEPVIVTRKNARSVVIMSLEDYNAIQETAYLLRSPANAENLRTSIKQYEQGKY